MAVAEIRAGSFALNVDAAANATPENDIRSGPTTLYNLTVDQLSTSDPVYIKFWDSLKPNVSSDEPVMVIVVKTLKKRSFPMVPGTGLSFTTGLSFLATLTPENTAAQTDPVITASSLPIITLLTDL